MAYTSKLGLMNQKAIRIFDLQRAPEALTDPGSVRSERQLRKTQAQTGSGTGGSVV